MGRRVSTNAAPRKAQAIPHDSEDSENSTGRSGVCQNSTDANPCSSTPVYATATSPAATPTAATPPTAAGRMRSPSSSSTSENPPAQTSARTSA